MPEILTPPPAPALSDERLEALRTHVVAEARARTPARHPRRRRTLLAAAAVAVAGAVAILAWSPGGVREQLIRAGVLPVTDDATALERAVRGVAAGGRLVHVVTVYHAKNGDLRTETWQAADGRARVRQTFPDGTVLENRIDGEGRESLDPERGVVVDRPWRTPDEEARMRRELAIFDLPAFLDAVRDGTIVDVGPGTFEGRAVLRYERTIGADTTTWYLDPATSWPVATWMRTRGVEGDPALGLERYEVFETVPADDELLELDVPAGTPRELDLPPEWAPLHEGDPAPAAIRQAFADTATLGDLAPERLPVPERAVVARVIELGPQSQYVLLTAPVEHGGLPCYVLQEQDREGEWHSPVAHCPGGSTGYGYPSLNPSRDGRWWTVAGVLPPEIERVALQVGTRRVPLATRDRIVADAVPAGAADEPVWLVITLGGGTPQRVGPKAGTTLAQFGLRPP